MQILLSRDRELLHSLKAKSLCDSETSHLKAKFNFDLLAWLIALDGKARPVQTPPSTFPASRFVVAWPEDGRRVLWEEGKSARQAGVLD